MQLLRISLLIVLLLTVFSSISAPKKWSPPKKGATEEGAFNPETTILSRFSFVRPDQWQWMSTEPNGDDIVTAIMFSAPEPGTENRALIFLNHYTRTAAAGERTSTEQRFKKWFREFKEPVPPQTVSVGTNKVTFVEYAGTYYGPSKNGKTPAARANYTLIGAVIEDPDGNIVGRLWGPTRLVEKNKADFKNMIVMALKQE
ncbi:MAG: hypothetical protein JWM68_3252 [Verrucomicrobiales bacterium]|nr:hypothetical protein [Verrucomicrobiales bacterium]